MMDDQMHRDLLSSSYCTTNSLSYSNPEPGPFDYNEDENDDKFNDLDDAEPIVKNVLSDIVSKSIINSSESSINNTQVLNVQNVNESKYTAPRNGSQIKVLPEEQPILKQTGTIENIVESQSSLKDTSSDFEEDTSMPGLDGTYDISKTPFENKSPDDLNKSLVDAIEVELNLIHGGMSNNPDLNDTAVTNHSMMKTKHDSILKEANDLEDIYSKINVILSQPLDESPPDTKLSKNKPDSKSFMEDSNHEKKTFDISAPSQIHTSDIRHEKCISKSIKFTEPTSELPSKNESKHQAILSDNDPHSNSKKDFCLTEKINFKDTNFDKNVSSNQDCKTNIPEVKTESVTNSAQSHTIHSDNDKNYDQGSIQNSELNSDNVEIDCVKSPIQNYKLNSGISNNDDIENNKYLVQNNKLNISNEDIDTTTSVQSLEVHNDDYHKGSTQNNGHIINNIEMNYNNNHEINTDISKVNHVNNLVQSNKVNTADNKDLSNDMSSVQKHEVLSDNDDINDDQGSTQNNELIIDNVEINSDISYVSNVNGLIQSHEVHNESDDEGSTQSNELITDNVEINTDVSNINNVNSLIQSDNVNTVNKDNDMNFVQSHEVQNDNNDVSDDEGSTQNNELITDNVEINTDVSNINNVNSLVQSQNASTDNQEQDNDKSSVQSHEVHDDYVDQGSTQNNDLLIDHVEMNTDLSNINNGNSLIQRDNVITVNKDQDNDMNFVQSHEVQNDNNDVSDDEGTLRNKILADIVKMNKHISNIDHLFSLIQSHNVNTVNKDRDNVMNSIQSHEIHNDNSSINDDIGNTQKNDIITDNIEINYNESYELNNGICNVSDNSLQTYKVNAVNDDIENDINLVQNHELNTDILNHGRISDTRSDSTQHFAKTTVEMDFNDIENQNNKLQFVNNVCQAKDNLDLQTVVLKCTEKINYTSISYNLTSNEECPSLVVQDMSEVSNMCVDKLSDEATAVTDSMASTSFNTAVSSHLISKERNIKNISETISNIISEHIKSVVIKCSEKVISSKSKSNSLLFDDHKSVGVDSSKQLDQSTTEAFTIIENILDNLTNEKADLTKKILKIINMSLDNIYYDEKKTGNFSQFVSEAQDNSTMNLHPNTEHNGFPEKEICQQKESCSSSFPPNDIFMQMIKDFNEDVKNASVSKKGDSIEDNEKENSRQCSSKNSLETSNDVKLLPRNMNKSPKTNVRSSLRCIKICPNLTDKTCDTMHNNSSQSTVKTCLKRSLSQNSTYTDSSKRISIKESESSTDSPKTNKDKIKNKYVKNSSNNSQLVHLPTIKNQDKNKICVAESSELKNQTTSRKRAAKTPISPPKAKILKRNSSSKVENSKKSNSPKVLTDSILDKKKNRKTQKLSYSSDEPSPSVKRIKRPTIKKSEQEENNKSIPTTSKTRNRTIDKCSLRNEAKLNKKVTQTIPKAKEEPSLSRVLRTKKKC